ncbi:MAG: hypothetical protein HFH85_07420 [Lachnospiraceae bacterium]|jgi:hypothetical protein|nr:hypothetical protein [Lachnospiraceae bacterium]
MKKRNSAALLCAGALLLGNGLESNFKTSDINDAIYNLQPGDSIAITVALENGGDKSTDWWMTNRVLRSLEDIQEAASGGGGYEMTCDGQHIVIMGLTTENSVRFLNSAVTLGEDSKYYVKGVRMGGRDNSTVDLAYFRVERDEDYVVAYGIRGNLVQYTVGQKTGRRDSAGTNARA